MSSVTVHYSSVRGAGSRFVSVVDQHGVEIAFVDGKCLAHPSETLEDISCPDRRECSRIRTRLATSIVEGATGLTLEELCERIVMQRLRSIRRERHQFDLL